MGEYQDRRIGGRIKEYILRNVGMLGIVFISLAYTATALITISRNEKTLAQIIVDGVTFLLLGVLVTRLFSLQGIMNGERDDRVMKTVTLHGETVERAEPFIDHLDAWCEVKNAQALKMQRTHILLRNGMKYEDYFDEEGIAREYVCRPFIEPMLPEPPAALSGRERDEWRLRELGKIKQAREMHDKQEAARLQFYTAALRVKLTPLSACALTGEMVRREDPFYFGRTKKEYERSSGRQDLILRVLAAIVFGFFSVELIENFSAADLVWKVLQVALAVAMGLVQMYQSHIYVTEEYRGAIIQKIDHLQMFLRTQEAGGASPSPTKEDLESDDLIKGKQEEQNNGNNECPEEHGAEIHV
jgi:hypothetical protein